MCGKLGGNDKEKSNKSLWPSKTLALSNLSHYFQRTDETQTYRLITFEDIDINGT